MKVSWSSVTELEDKVNFWVSARRAQFDQAVSEFQISEDPPRTQGKRRYLNSLTEDLEKKEKILRFRRKKLPFRLIFSLACQSWFYPEPLKSAVQFLILEEERIRFNLQHPELDIVLSSKGECILYLQERVTVLGWRWLFGSIFTDKWYIEKKSNGYNSHFEYELFSLLPKYYWKEKRRPVKPQFRRGYRDHGTLAARDERARRAEYRKEFSLVLEQQKIEDRRTSFQNFTDFLKGWFQ